MALISAMKVPLRHDLKVSHFVETLKYDWLLWKNTGIFLTTRSWEEKSFSQKPFNLHGAVGRERAGWVIACATIGEWSDIPLGKYSTLVHRLTICEEPTQRSIQEREPWVLEKQENCLVIGYFNQHTLVQPTSVSRQLKMVPLLPKGGWTRGCLSNLGSR